MKVWEKYICAANRHYSNSNFDAALTLYHAAGKEAELLLPTWNDPAEGVSALVVTYLNMADLYQSAEQTRTARDVLISIHNRTLRLLMSTH